MTWTVKALPLRKLVGLEVSAENMKYVFIVCQQIAGQNYDKQIANKSFKNTASSNNTNKYKLMISNFHSATVLL
jgi:hypothetical protein